MTSSNDELDAKVRRQNIIIAILVVLMVGAGFLVVEERTKSASQEAINEVQNVQHSQCLAGNASRLGQFDLAEDNEAMYRELEGQEHDPEIADIYRRAALRKEKAAESVLAAARQRGELLDPNSPVVQCEFHE